MEDSWNEYKKDAFELGKHISDFLVKHIDQPEPKEDDPSGHLEFCQLAGFYELMSRDVWFVNRISAPVITEGYLNLNDQGNYELNGIELTNEEIQELSIDFLHEKDDTCDFPYWQLAILSEDDNGNIVFYADPERPVNGIYIRIRDELDYDDGNDKRYYEKLKQFGKNSKIKKI